MANPGWPGRKGKSNINPSAVAYKYAVVRSFSPSSILRIKFFLLTKYLEMLKNLFLI